MTQIGDVLGRELVRAGWHRRSPVVYGNSTVLPVVLRDSSAVRGAASFSGKGLVDLIFTAPLRTTSNSSFAVACRSSRLAA